MLNIKCNASGINQATLEIADITGKQVMQDVQLNFPGNPAYISIYLPELKPGSYICRIFNEKFTESKRIIVLKQ